MLRSLDARQPTENGEKLASMSINGSARARLNRSAQALCVNLANEFEEKFIKRLPSRRFSKGFYISRVGNQGFSEGSACVQEGTPNMRCEQSSVASAEADLDRTLSATSP